ncbi:oxidoreductase family protein [Perilla frutescens var. hirtella]|uniref:Ubiquinone biosynthesis monooxygenase COQ6, mitochondrial n=1 Tax=Perilla frutescens var. hirtella TaxID=608512 RepID=A0AAD4J2G5_PERFH|nr:oxidoreductase family protein [Perilla frutescens var. hirtella]
MKAGMANTDIHLHRLCAQFVDLDLVLQVHPREMNFELIVQHIQLVDHLSSVNDSVDYKAHGQNENSESALRTVRESTKDLGVGHRHNNSLDVSLSMQDVNGCLHMKNGKDIYRNYDSVTLLKTSGVSSCHASINLGTSGSSLMGPTSFTLKLPPFVCSVNFDLITMMLEFLKEMSNCIGTTSLGNGFTPEPESSGESRILKLGIFDFSTFRLLFFTEFAVATQISEFALEKSLKIATATLRREPAVSEFFWPDLVRVRVVSCRHGCGAQIGESEHHRSKLNTIVKLVTARRVAFDMHVWKLAKRTLCSGAGAKLPAAAIEQGLVEKQICNSNLPVHDVAIVGGGMVGMALACSLAKMPLTNQLNVAIIDSNPALQSGHCIKQEDPPDPRVSTVTPATIAHFKDVGVWKYVEEHRHAYFDKMQVWDYTGLGYTRYHARDINKKVLGCVVENKVLHKSLLSCLQGAGSQHKIYPLKLSSMTLEPVSASSPHGSLAKLELSDGNSLYAKLVVGADGSKSRVKELAGINSTGWKYSQNAVICTVEHMEENQCAWQRFIPNGPIALLPVGDKFSNIVWTMDPEESLNRKSLSEVDFVKEVNRALDNGYGPHPKSQSFGGASAFSWLTAEKALSAYDCFEVPPKITKLASERMVFPLSLNHANSYAVKRVVLIGDAAHTVHPLAGQGVNMGFGDAFSLSNVIAEGIAVGSDIGEVSLLRRYESDRKPANLTMMAILDGFQKAYSVDFGPLNVLRAAAFQGAQYFSPLKRNIISYASGEQRFPLIS